MESKRERNKTSCQALIYDANERQTTRRRHMEQGRMSTGRMQHKKLPVFLMRHEKEHSESKASNPRGRSVSLVNPIR